MRTLMTTSPPRNRTASDRPRPGNPGVNLVRNLTLPCLVRELPEQLANLLTHRRGDRIPHPHEASRGTDGQFAVSLRDALAGQDRRLPLFREEQALQVVELLVVERIVRLGEVDLLPRVGDLRHLVRLLRGPRDIFGKIQVAVRPHRGIDAPAGAGDPRTG